MKIINFRGDLRDISAKKEALMNAKYWNTITFKYFLETLNIQMMWWWFNVWPEK